MFLQDTKHGSFLVSVWQLHEKLNANGGPTYRVDITDAPRQLPLLNYGAAPIEMIYPIWDRLADFEVRVMDDFGNLERVPFRL